MADDVMTKEEVELVDKAIAETKAQLKVKQSEIDSAKEAGRKEAEKELKLQQELDAQRKAREELESKLAEQKKLQEEQSKKFQEQLDALKTTKLPVQSENPFAQTAPSAGLKNLTREELDAIEEASREQFYKEKGPGSR